MINMVRKKRKSGKMMKYLLIFNVALVVTILLYMFLYYSYYEWGQNENVSWITLS